MRFIKSIRIVRKIRLKDLELFLLREGYYGKIISYMLFIDLNRASTLNDFPKLKEIEDENNFGRSNFIKVIFFSKEALNDKVKEELISISGGFLENKDDCDWNADFVTVCDNNYDIDKIEWYIENYIKVNYGLQINLKNIPSFKFNKLSQD